MNRSDDVRIADKGARFEHVEDGVRCLKHVFESSGRTTYIYYSAELAARKRHAAERKVEKMMEVIKNYDEAKKVKASDLVSIKSNRFADVPVHVSVETHMEYDDPRTFENKVDEETSPRSGYFKLGSSSELTSSEALRKYRKRVTVEHLISSMKRVTGIKPLRVWKRGSTRIDGAGTSLRGGRGNGQVRAGGALRDEEERRANDRSDDETGHGFHRPLPRSFDSNGRVRQVRSRSEVHH